MTKIKYKKLIIRIVIVLIILMPLSILIKIKFFKPEQKEKLSLLEYDVEVVDDNLIVTRLSTQNKEKEEREKYIWPTDSNYYISTYFSNYHDGVDIAGISYNSNIYAIYDGEVITSGYTYTNGNYIIIKDSKGTYSMYAHLTNRYVNANDKVTKGQVIGTAGTTGNSTGVHLHFSVWNGYPYQGGKAFNPFDLY